MYTLNENSRIANLYKWFYNPDEMPTSGCVYFRQVFFMFIFIIPYTLFVLPLLLTRKFDNTQKGETVLVSIILYTTLIGIGLLLFTFTLFFISYPEQSLGLHIQLAGLFLWVVLILSLVFKTIDSIFEYITTTRLETPKEPNIFVEFIRAQNNRYCPKLTWVKK